MLSVATTRTTRIFILLGMLVPPLVLISGVDICLLRSQTEHISFWKDPRDWPCTSNFPSISQPCLGLPIGKFSWAGGRGCWERLKPWERLQFGEEICQATPALTKALGLPLLDNQVSVLRLTCFRCTINYEERMKGADKWENIMHNYENIKVYGHVLRAYGLPGTEPGRGATKTNTVCCLTEETDACSDKCEGWSL